MSSLKKLFIALKTDTWVKPLFAAYKKPFVLAIVLGLFTFLFAAGLMFTSGYLISASATIASVLMLYIPLFFVQIFGLGRPILNYFERLTSHDWVFRVTTLLRTKLYHTLEPQGIFYRASVRLGDTLGLLSEDIAYIQDLYLRSVFPILIASLLYLVLAIVLGFFSGALMLLWLIVLGGVIFILPLASIALYGPKNRLIKLYTHELYEELSDSIQGANDWLYSGRSQEFIDTLEAKIAKRSQIQSWLTALDHGRDFLLQLSFLLIILATTIWAGTHFGNLANENVDWLNWIAAFSLAFFPLIDAFAIVPSAATTGADKIVSIKRLNSLDSFMQSADAEKYAPDHDDILSQSTHGSALPHADYCLNNFDLALANVSFCYAKSTKPTITNFTLDIPHGTKLMLLGSSGVGKSTLSQLIRGDLIPDTGQISLGGIPLSTLRDNIADYICVVSQDPHLFDITIAENIRLGNSHATEADLWAVLDALNLTELVNSLPGKLQGRIGENAHKLSGGQRQRLALARALVSNAPILLFDEATSALDPMTERSVLSLILSGWTEKTIIFITHHMTMAPAFDMIVHLKEDAIDYSGTFETLQQSNSKFRSLYALDSKNAL